MDVITKSPGQCTPDELDLFVRLVRVGGEVTAERLTERVREAHTLIYIKEAGQILGVAALKHPRIHYRSGVFEKAQASVDAAEYPLELGWVYVPPESRGRGLSYNLVKVALAQADGVQIFATSKANNKPMHKALLAGLFVREGCEYQSERGEYELALFISKCGV